MDTGALLPKLLAAAWLAPLVAFAALALTRPRCAASKRRAGLVATGAIALSAVLSQIALWAVWLPTHGISHNYDHALGFSIAGPTDSLQHVPFAYSGDWYNLAEFGRLKFSIGYYIDALTVVMFVVVTLVATCVHIYSFGYMRNELADFLIDPEAIGGQGRGIRRPGRFHRFYQDLSLFSFGMLGLVIAGNLLMVFVFWELVGIASYLLIGFYFERLRAAAAAMKAFVVNRIGDAGLIAGMAALLGAVGTLDFGNSRDQGGNERPGLFSLLRPAENEHRLTVPDTMLTEVGAEEVARIAREHRDPAAGGAEIASRVGQWRDDWSGNSPGRAGYWLLVLAGVGIFCGCVGKSAQAPLHVWLPDAMEGPTPVSALVHSATMVAAGVYLVGRCYPLFAAETLLAIGVVGCVTFCLGATIAVAVSDIKRVLAWSTVSQLGLMMLAMGTGDWLPALFHLVTHAAFKSLLFLGAGSVIHAMHTNEMPLMGGLRRKMPWTAYTMLVGCLAVAGAGVPPLIGLSGYYSKDAIIAQTMAFRASNPAWSIFFFAAMSGSALTSLYIFRMWYMTFAGECRDRRKFDAAHESPRSMVAPLALLAILAIGAGWSLGPLSVEGLLEAARPAGTELPQDGALLTKLHYPAADAGLAFHGQATWAASLMGLAGFLLATIFYGLRLLDPREAQQQFTPLYRFLRNAWYIDRVYGLAIVQPTIKAARLAAVFDRRWIDWFIDSVARATRWLARLDDAFDRRFVDGAVNALANGTYRLGLSLRRAQTGRLRQYVLFTVVGTVMLFILISYALTVV